MPIVEALISEKRGLDRQSLATERRILPGVLACLEAAATLVGHQTVASGAGAQRSVRKLDGHGLGAFFCWQCATFGDLAAHRTELLQDVLAKSRAHGPLRHIVLGDTPEDIIAARALGLSVIAIASGAYSSGDLADYHPDLLMGCAEPADLAEFVSHME
jgi:phosphoglycolate phosphatase-like HAD superfamily hydrolase